MKFLAIRRRFPAVCPRFPKIECVENEQLCSPEIALNIHENGFLIPKIISDVKIEKYETFCASKLL